MTDVARPKRARLAEALACVLPYTAAIDGTPEEHIGTQRRRLAEGGRATDRGFEIEFGGAPLVLPWSIVDPREAWETLCTRLDLAGAVDDPRRAFQAGRVDKIVEHLRPTRRVVATADGKNYDIAPERLRDGVTLGDELELPHPPTIAACVALAADWPGVLAAEEIARELAGVDRVVWRVGATGQRGTDHWAFTGGPEADLDAALAPLGYAIDRVTADHVVLLAPAL